jgi:hypothetical protein
MSVNSEIQSQYQAALEMIKEAVTRCPEELWDDTAYKNRFWNIAYHALFYTHLYLQPNLEAFSPWEKHRPDSEQMQASDAYSKTEVLEYLMVCQDQVARQAPELDMDGSSGFYWIPMNKLELQFYNIRHLQHHTGELCERLGKTGAVEIGWIGMKQS